MKSAGTRRVMLIGGVVGLLALTVWCIRKANPPEPVYLGRPLESWLREFDNPQQSTNFAAAREAILHMGTNVLPHLEHYLRHRDSRWHQPWIQLQAKLHLLRQPVDDDYFWHRRAAYAVGQFGEAGAPAFPAMMEAAQTRRAEQEVAWALSWMLPRSAPVLTNLLASTNPWTRYRAADALGTAPSHPSVAELSRAALLNALRDSDPGLRVSAASALGMSVGVSAEHRAAVIPALMAALDDPDPNVRGNAATSLSNYGTNAQVAVPQLLKMLQDTNEYPRKRSAWVLWRIDPQTAKQLGVEPGR